MRSWSPQSPIFRGGGGPWSPFHYYYFFWDVTSFLFLSLYNFKPIYAILVTLVTFFLGGGSKCFARHQYSQKANDLSLHTAKSTALNPQHYSDVFQDSIVQQQSMSKALLGNLSKTIVKMPIHSTSALYWYIAHANTSKIQHVLMECAAHILLDS